MRNKKEWYSSNELVGLDGMPSSPQGVNKKARTQGWDKRSKEGTQGRGIEYHYSSLPEATRKHLGFQSENKNTVVTTTETQAVSTELVSIPQYDLAASAGGGSLVVSEQTVARFEFSQSWLREQGLANKRLTIVPIKGDSMEETLSDGDLTLVSLVESPQDAREGVCVLRYDDEIFVKRIQYDYKDQGYRIVSDNPQYSEFYIDKEDVKAGRFSVLGRIERILRTL